MRNDLIAQHLTVHNSRTKETVMKTTWTRDELFAALLTYDHRHGDHRNAGSFEGRSTFTHLVGTLTGDERAAFDVTANTFWAALPSGSPDA